MRKKINVVSGIVEPAYAKDIWMAVEIAIAAGTKRECVDSRRYVA